MVLCSLLFQVTWDWVILGLTFYTVVMVPFNLAVYRTSYTSTGDITFMVVDSIVDIIFLIDIIFNFHTSFVGSDGAVIVDEAKIRSEFSAQQTQGESSNFSILPVKLGNYLRSGFAIDVMACLPYDALNIFDMTSEPPTHDTLTLSTIAGENVSDTLAAGIEPVSSGTSYGNIFSILKVSSSLFYLAIFFRN